MFSELDISDSMRKAKPSIFLAGRNSDVMKNGPSEYHLGHFSNILYQEV